MRSSEKKILEGLENQFKKYKKTHSLALQVFHKGKEKIKLTFGKPYKYYDLSSLTKIIFIAPCFMNLLENKKVTSLTKVSDIWEEIPLDLKIFDLLSHRTPLPAVLSYRYKVSSRKDWKEKRRDLKRILESFSYKSGKGSTYSDVGFMILGFLLEEIYEKNIFQIWEELRKKWKLSTMRFHPGNRPFYRRSFYAPTTRDHFIRKKLQGTVHDGNTWKWGGVSSHAGLFSSLEDVSRWGLLFRQSYLGISSRFAKQKTLHLFLKKRSSHGGLGFMIGKKPRFQGKYFSSKTVGHLGYSGTSFWYDPKEDLMVSLLTNRQKKEDLFLKKVRPYVHNHVWENLC